MNSEKRVSARRLWVITRLLALPCLLIAGASIVVGGHDAVIGVQLGQRLVGFFLTLCGVALLAALFIFLVEDFRRVRKRGSYAPSDRLPLAPTLFLMGAVPGVLLAVVEISTSVARGLDWRFDWRLLLWLVAALVPLTIAALLWPIHRPQGFGKIPRVITFLSAAGLIGAAQSMLSSYYEPVKHGDALSVNTELAASGLLLEKKGRHPMRQLQALRGTVSLENLGDVRLLFLGGMYLVTGYNARSTTDQPNFPNGVEKQLADRKKGMSPFGGVDPYEVVGPTPSVVKTGIFFDPGSNWIAAGTKVQMDFLAYVPRGRFERYVSTVILVAARADRMRLATPKAPLHFISTSVPKNRSGVSVTRDIAETSWVNTVTRKSLHVFVTYRLPPPSSPFPIVDPCVQSEVSYCYDRNVLALRGRINDSYGLNTFPAWYSLQMPSNQ